MLTSGNIFWPPKPCLLVIQKEGRETACGNTQRQAKPNPLQRLGGDQNKYKTCRWLDRNENLGKGCRWQGGGDSNLKFNGKCLKGLNQKRREWDLIYLCTYI